MTIAVRLIPLVLSIALMSPALARADTLTLLSATSVKETGLMDVLLDSYRKWTHLKNIKVEAVSLPSAKAFETAMRGEADVLFVHDR
ncbi:MAG TPA: tungsten ABC transporter substrate-binding protein, partial [Nitrospirota bacterium]|nr:tungsten ABC transporter substrate-binding protein [Nitrospirota bacterium]